jgi:hypothetical protein
MNAHFGIWMVAGLAAALKLMTNDVMQPSPWPVLKERHEQFAFVAPEGPGVDQPWLLHLTDAAGTEQYRLECHAGEHGEDDLLKWSGLYQCALFPAKGDSVTAVDLLAADTKQEQRDDGWNRGRILAQQFHAPCISYPEYSTLRHFKLRGMDLTLSFTDIVWQGPKLQKFKLHVDVILDEDAKSDVAEIAAGDTPPHACFPGPKTLEK